MVPILVKANDIQGSKSMTNWSHVLKKSRIFVNKVSKEPWPSRLSQEKGKKKTSGQKEKPHGKKKKTHGKKKLPRSKKKNLTAKENKNSSRHQRNFAESLFLFAVRLILLP